MREGYLLRIVVVVWTVVVWISVDDSCLELVFLLTVFVRSGLELERELCGFGLTSLLRLVAVVWISIGMSWLEAGFCSVLLLVVVRTSSFEWERCGFGLTSLSTGAAETLTFQKLLQTSLRYAEQVSVNFLYKIITLHQKKDDTSSVKL